MNGTAFYKQLKRLTKYKSTSLIPDKIKMGGEVVEDKNYPDVVADNVLKGALKPTNGNTAILTLPSVIYDQSELDLFQESCQKRRRWDQT